MKQLVKIFVILFILYLIWQIQRNNVIDKSVEYFANIFDPSNILEEGSYCPNSLIKKDNKFYLINSNRPMVDKKNPRVFDSYNDYLKYANILHQNRKCPIISQSQIQYKQNAIKKAMHPRDDPQETYQKRCNKSTAQNLYGLDNEIYYAGKDFTPLVPYNIDVPKNDLQQADFLSNYNVEECMKDMFVDEHDGLKATPLN